MHRQVTYGQFGTLVAKTRQRLRIAGIKRGDVVALYLPPSAQYISAALATMYAGAAYLPVDLNCPLERLSFIITDSDARMLITTAERREGIRVPESVSVVKMDCNEECERHSEVLQPPDHVVPDDLAYLIYTSGSTGQPKGVELTHRGLNNLIDWHNAAFHIGQKDRGSQIADLSFDAAVWEIWPYLVSGAALCIPPSHLRYDPVQLQQWLLDEEVSVSFVPTILAESLCRMIWPQKSALRFLLTGGDALRVYPRKDLPFTLVNNYGPTECTVVTTSGPVSAEGGCNRPPAIGYPISRADVHLLGEDLKPVSAGEIGEICVGGPSLARGYRNRPEMTAEKFIRNPLDETPGARLYRTGDLARISEDGQFHFLGRMDDQIKIRGHRIEPNEVAAAITRNPRVMQCVVVAREGHGAKMLVAFVVASGVGPISQQEILDSLRKILPDYMIPSAVICLDKLPLTARGKIDQAALKAIGTRNTLGRKEFLATELQRQVAAIVCSLLNLDELGIEDNFFLLGGHSLFGAQLIECLRVRLNAEVSLRALFEAPTVASLAAHIEYVLSQQIASTAD